MKGNKYFLDTNIFVYAFEEDALAKRKQANNLIKEAIVHKQGVISYQVVQEFLHVATRKFKKKLKTTDVKEYLQRLLYPLCQVYPAENLYQLALDIQDNYHYSFYDALIIAAAVEAGCKTLYTEDLHHGQIILGLQIINPFKEVKIHAKQ